jgi:anti-anti-sigma factor
MTDSITPSEMAATNYSSALPGQFELRVQPDRHAVRVIPVGELGLATAPRLRDQLDQLVSAGFTSIVVDLRALEFADSAGLAVLISAHAAAQHDGWELSLIQGPRAIRRLFEITGTLDRLPFTPTPGSANGRHSRPAVPD